MVYLGLTLHASGRSVTEVSRRIGLAAAESGFSSGVWKHGAITLNRQLDIFSAVVTKLKYALASAWLMKSDLRKLDGLYRGCLRRILRIPHAYYSRTSNQTVLQRAGCRKLSETIRESQLNLLRKVLNDPALRILKETAFHGQTLVPETAAWVRRRGRPRQNWIEELMRV